MIQLSTHFSLDEATFSSTAERLGIDNRAPESVKDALYFAAEGMEQVRSLLKFPIHIDSWYRCPELNAAVKGAPNSTHMTGYAVDFICPDYGTPYSIAQAIAAADIKVDQLIFEGTWIHVSFAPAARGQILTAQFTPNGTTYRQGLA